MLYCLDIDGTLIRSFMREQGETRDFEHVCPRCGEVGTLELREDSEWHCERCPWAGDENAAVYDRVEVLPGRHRKLSTLALGPITPGVSAPKNPRFALVTNQGGVAFGYQTVEQVYAKIGRVLAAFSFFDGCPVSVHVAFNHPKATVEQYRRDDRIRKPGPGMLLQAMRRHRMDAVTTVMVGDMHSDRHAAGAAGVRYYDAEEFFR